MVFKFRLVGIRNTFIFKSLSFKKWKDKFENLRDKQDGEYLSHYKSYTESDLAWKNPIGIQALHLDSRHLGTILIHKTFYEVNHVIQYTFNSKIYIYQKHISKKSFYIFNQFFIYHVNREMN